MTDINLALLSNSLARLVSEPVSLLDVEPIDDPKTEVLRQQIMASYSDALKDLPTEQHGIWFMRRLAALESRMLLLSAAMSTASNIELPVHKLTHPVNGPVPRSSAVRISLEDANLLTGFYDLESERDAIFRWVGPQPLARVAVPRVIARSIVTIEIHSAYPKISIERVRVRLDGGAWTTGTIAPGRGLCNLHFPVNPGTSVGLTSTLEIDTVRTESPSSTGSEDTRELSIAIRGITITQQ